MRNFKLLSKVLLPMLFIFTISATSLYAESQRTMVNLRGEQVLVPIDVPSKERFVFQRVVSADGLIVFLYSDPKFRRPVDYAETYNVAGELLEVAWYKPSEGVRIAQDINLDNPKANGPARILEIIEPREHIRDTRATKQGRLSLQAGEKLPRGLEVRSY